MNKSGQQSLVPPSEGDQVKDFSKPNPCVTAPASPVCHRAARKNKAGPRVSGSTGAAQTYLASLRKALAFERRTPRVQAGRANKTGCPNRTSAVTTPCERRCSRLRFCPKRTHQTEVSKTNNTVYIYIIVAVLPSS